MKFIINLYFDQVNSRGGSLGIDLTAAAQQHLESEFGHNEVRRLLSGLNSGTLAAEDQYRVMDAMSRFGDQQAQIYAQNFTQDDLRATYDSADKPTLDPSNVPEPSVIQTTHAQNADALKADAAKVYGIPTAPDVDANAAIIQDDVDTELKAQKGYLNSL